MTGGASATDRTGRNHSNGGYLWRNQGIGRSVDEPGRPRVRLPPLRRRDLRGEPPGESPRAIPPRLLENSTVCEKPVLQPRQTGQAQRAPAQRALSQSDGTWNIRATDEPAQRHRVGLGAFHPPRARSTRMVSLDVRKGTEFPEESEVFAASTIGGCGRGISTISDGEFDPGSGRTLAACLTHASRARPIRWQHWTVPSGERVSNTWATCP